VGNAHWIRVLLLIVLGLALAGVAYLIQQRQPRKRNRFDPGDVITGLILLGGAVESLSPNASLLSQACLVGLVGWAGSWLAQAWHGD
jgi:hypothetical protein